MTEIIIIRERASWLPSCSVRHHTLLRDVKGVSSHRPALTTDDVPQRGSVYCEEESVKDDGRERE